jgi:hypothetical protein
MTARICGSEGHLPAGGRFGDQAAQALGREAVEIPLARRGRGQQRTDFSVKQPVPHTVDGVFDNNASLLFEDFINDAEFLAAADPLNAAHISLLPCRMFPEHKGAGFPFSKKSRDFVIFIIGLENTLGAPSNPAKRSHKTCTPPLPRPTETGSPPPS